MEKRLEEDSMGKIEVPVNALWGAQTERSLLNFRVGTEKMPIEVIHALALVKKAAAMVNRDLGEISKEKCDLIVASALKVQEGLFDDHFPLVVWQTGSGTQTHMNINEVIANLANESVGEERGSKKPIHPNDDVNRGQSSNDIVPTAISVAVAIAVKKRLLPALETFKKALQQKQTAFQEIVKCGRTHLMDATPLTLGQEFSAFVEQIENHIAKIHFALNHTCELAIGGTAVGTGLNAHPEFAKRVAKVLSEETKIPFVTAPNKFEALSTVDSLASLSSVLKGVAISYMKVANDIRLLGSGPRCGLNELSLPENEPGSSIMPGKVNPTQCEMMTQVAAQVIGNDAAVTVAATHGHLQLNVFRPVVAYNLLQSIRLLGDAATNFVEKCLIDLIAREENIAKHLQESLMLVTALNPHIGYDKAAKIAKKAYLEGITLKEAGVSLGFLTGEQFAKWVLPRGMCGE
ncbi:MAG: class II fumarate hydratase [Verrucomicrobia bacterium]|nr:class II fumarate hydratase [Verrucomicrobiota bacterium]